MEEEEPFQLFTLSHMNIQSDLHRQETNEDLINSLQKVGPELHSQTSNFSNNGLNVFMTGGFFPESFLKTDECYKITKSRFVLEDGLLTRHNKDIVQYSCTLPYLKKQKGLQVSSIFNKCLLLKSCIINLDNLSYTCLCLTMLGDA